VTPELPQNIEAERATLGAALISPDALIRILPWMQAAWFYKERHRAIYQTLLDIRTAGGTPDAKALIIALTGSGQLEALGGIDYLTGLLENAMSWQIEDYGREVERCAVLRQLIGAGTQITKLGYQYDLGADEAIGSAQQQLAKIAVRSAATGLITFDALADRQYEWLNDGVVPGICTGFRDLDEITGGLHNGDLVLVAARPSMGKTALLLNIADRIARRGDHDCLIFSLEMTKDQLMQRAAAMEARINLLGLRMMRLSPADADRYMSALGTLAALPIAVDDTPSASVAALRASASRHQAQRGRPLILFVDYIQLMATPGFKPDQRVAAVSSISRDLKSLARELDCPVVALSQLSRAVEARQSKVPMMSDLRESGALEQDADVVLFIYRDEVYDKETDKKGIAELHIAKHRNGPIGVVPMRFDASTTRFDDLTFRTLEGYDE
jgi:replicative DNA helicase